MSFTALRALEANMLHIAAAGVSAASVGLGQTHVLRSSAAPRLVRDEVNDPIQTSEPMLFVDRLRTLIDSFMYRISEVKVVASKMTSGVLYPRELLERAQQYRLLVEDKSLDLWISALDALRVKQIDYNRYQQQKGIEL